MKFNSQQIFLLLQRTGVSKTQIWINFAVSIWCYIIWSCFSCINLFSNWISHFFIHTNCSLSLHLLMVYSSFFLSGSNWWRTGCGPRHADWDLQQNPDAGVPCWGGSCDAGHEGRADCGGEETGMYLYATHSMLVLFTLNCKL